MKVGLRCFHFHGCWICFLACAAYRIEARGPGAGGWPAASLEDMDMDVHDHQPCIGGLALELDHTQPVDTPKGVLNSVYNTLADVEADYNLKLKA